jgi:hypothetical protein
MTVEEEKKWRELCNQAMSEHNPNKLLNIFLTINRLMEKEQRLPEPFDSSRSTLSF